MRVIGISLGLVLSTTVAFAEPINGSSIAAGLGTLNVNYDTMEDPDSSAYFIFDATQFLDNSFFLNIDLSRGLQSWDDGTREMSFISSTFDVALGYEHQLNNFIGFYGQGGWRLNVGDLWIAEDGNETNSERSQSGLTIGTGLSFSSPYRIRGSVGTIYESLTWDDTDENETDITFNTMLGFDVTDSIHLAGFGHFVPSDSSAYALGIGYRY